MQVGGWRWGGRHFSHDYHIWKSKSTEKFITAEKIILDLIFIVCYHAHPFLFPTL
nr:MAG TPA: hypothetical protein [Caudoviricetes sp.]